MLSSPHLLSPLPSSPLLSLSPLPSNPFSPFSPSPPFSPLSLSLSLLSLSLSTPLSLSPLSLSLPPSLPLSLWSQVAYKSKNKAEAYNTQSVLDRPDIEHAKKTSTLASQVSNSL